MGRFLRVFLPTFTNTQQDQKAKLDYHMSVLFAYMADGEGLGVRGFIMFFSGGQIFSSCFVCVWGEGGARIRFSTSPSVKKITDSLLLIND